VAGGAWLGGGERCWDGGCEREVGGFVWCLVSVRAGGAGGSALRRWRRVSLSRRDAAVARKGEKSREATLAASCSRRRSRLGGAVVVVSVWVDRLRGGAGPGTWLERPRGRVRFAGRRDERPGSEADVERTDAELTANAPRAIEGGATRARCPVSSIPVAIGPLGGRRETAAFVAEQVSRLRFCSSDSGSSGASFEQRQSAPRQ
jgi:hypothetical protein